MEIIPKNASIIKTPCNIRSADNSILSVGKLKLKKSALKFSLPNIPINMSFDEVYVVDNLANSVNLGRSILNEIEAIWDFQSLVVSIQDHEVPLVNQKDKDNLGYISNILTNSSGNKFLYSKDNVYIPPRSSTLIRLKQSTNSEDLQEDVWITPDEHLESNKKK